MEEGKFSGKQILPKDSYNLAYTIHFVLGAGTLLPWNALITAVDYFAYLYPNKHVDKSFSIAYMGSSLPVLILLLGWTSWRKRPSINLRINLGYTLYVYCLLITPVMDWVHPSESQRCSRDYSITVASVAICGLSDGLIAGSLIGSVGQLPRRYMQAVFAGTACSGVLVSTLRLITKASLPQTAKGLQKSAHLHFLVSTGITLGCIACYNILERLPIMKYYNNQRTPSMVNQSSLYPSDPPIVSAPPLFNDQSSKERPKFWEVWRRIRWLAFGVFIIYAVTLSIFPGYITENVRSKLLKDWYPLILITIYNVFDLVGKTLTSVYVPSSTRNVTWSCTARLLFYPLFAACLHGSKIFRSEIYVILLSSLLGLSNGFLTSSLMILAPKSVPIEEAETAGIVMVLFLGFGLLGGSIVGWFWVI